jgi:hypothetical protein
MEGGRNSAQGTRSKGTAHHEEAAQEAPQKMNPHFTEKENLCIARISLRASQFELRLLKQAAKAGRIPSSRTIITRSMAHAFAKAFADPKP